VLRTRHQGLDSDGWAEWTAASSHHLGGDELRVYALPLELAPERVAVLRSYLSPAERERATRFRFPALARRFIVAHGVLREVLGAVVGVAAADLTFESGAHGKPALGAPWTDVRFSLSHADTIALLAVTRGRDVGVDVERVRPHAGLDRLADRVLGANERMRLRQLAAGEHAAGFFTCWTRKEAVLKGLGTGLSIAPDAVAVSPVRGELDLTAATSALPPLDGWRLFDLPAIPGYAAAAAASAPAIVRCHRLR
jgi:4'-phosphopantetheinyl transferase